MTDAGKRLNTTHTLRSAQSLLHRGANYYHHNLSQLTNHSLGTLPLLLCFCDSSPNSYTSAIVWIT